MSLLKAGVKILMRKRTHLGWSAISQGGLTPLLAVHRDSHSWLTTSQCQGVGLVKKA
jgi:hypothetical protein